VGEGKVEMMDLLLINPGNRLSQFGGVSEYATIAQPLGLAMLAAFVREKGFDVSILDAECLDYTPQMVADHIEKAQPVFIGLTAFTTKATACNAIIREIRDREIDVKIIYGGHHPSAIPELTLLESGADIVVKGEGYAPILSILRGDLNPIQQGAAMGDISNLPIPAWDLLPMDKYRAHHWQTWGIGQPNSFALQFTSLGCPFACSFCSVNVVYGSGGYRIKTPERVLDELDVLAGLGIKHIEIIDDTFTLDTDHVVSICDGIVERGYDFNMWAFTRTDRTVASLMDKMKEAGINWVFMGVETGSDKLLKAINKRQDISGIKKAVGTAKDAGMNVGANYIFGLEDDTTESMQQTLDLAIELNTEWANFFPAMPYPGTQMYDEANKGDLPTEWEQYGFFAPTAKPLPTKTVSSQDVVKFRDYAFQSYFGGARYQDMIERKFGKGDYIREMCKKKIGRKIT